MVAGGCVLMNCAESCSLSTDWPDICHDEMIRERKKSWLERGGRGGGRGLRKMRWEK